jgi:pyridoxamine 5'-phosphate oxidase
MDHPLNLERRDYGKGRLLEREAEPDPLRQFDAWFDEAVRADLLEPNAMALATVDADGQPSVRIVLLKGYDARGLVFYTDYTSRKGRELEANPRAALCFWWGELERQVRIEGSVHRVSDEESDAYFASRPRESQLGAVASSQSEVIASREALERRLRKVTTRHQDQPIPRPPNWGGYRLVPSAIEFWQGRESRMHDRLRYRRSGRRWIIERLSP